MYFTQTLVSLFQELQRRLDQTLGKPGSYLAGIDRAGNVKPMTIGARLYRLEQQVKFNCLYDKNLEYFFFVWPFKLFTECHTTAKSMSCAGSFPIAVLYTCIYGWGFNVLILKIGCLDLNITFCKLK